MARAWPQEVDVVEIPAYADKYRFTRLERTDGILRLALHTEGGPFQWTLEAQRELVSVFTDVGADRANRLIILTGSGDEFSGPYQSARRTVYNQGGVSITSEGLDRV